jgi:hypothetical protein
VSRKTEIQFQFSFIAKLKRMRRIVSMRSLYAWINDVNFSSDVLEKCTEELFVLRVSDVTWSDWGEPQRVLGMLSSLGVQMDWMPMAA